jgi:uncharacterized protein (DUF433 family)
VIGPPPAAGSRLPPDGHARDTADADGRPVGFPRARSRVVFDRITFDPNVLRGRACIRGMRIPVSVIVGQIAHGAAFDEILEGYPDLEREDVQQAIEYAAWLAQEQVQLS